MMTLFAENALNHAAELLVLLWTMLFLQQIAF
jgi:hypothetical protein